MGDEADGPADDVVVPPQIQQATYWSRTGASSICVAARAGATVPSDREHTGCPHGGLLADPAMGLAEIVAAANDGGA